MEDKIKKVNMTITLDPTIKKEAKEKIPNISKDIEEYLKKRLNSENSDEYRIREEILIKQQLMMQTQSEIDFLEAQLKNLTGYNQDKKEREDYVWRKLLSYYRDTGYTHPKLINEAIEVLNTTERILEDTLPFVRDSITPRNGVQMREWEYIKENYLQVSRCESL